MIQEAVESRVMLWLPVLTLEDLKYLLPAFIDAIGPFSKLDPKREAGSYTETEELRGLYLSSFRAIPDEWRNFVCQEAFMTSVELVEIIGKLRVKRDAVERDRQAA